MKQLLCHQGIFFAGSIRRSTNRQFAIHLLYFQAIAAGKQPELATNATNGSHGYWPDW
jgi:hypothetical protein